ncbi:MAG: tRNA epoxyqueuosine(34) reductase QueG [Thermomicrobiales bacterium]|nr:tRNA epoxyqueuosine(34) reductase QueG [Thermomicrobiales bacterium]
MELTARPLLPIPSPDPRCALTGQVKLLAAECGLSVARVTTMDPFPALEPLMLEHIAAGRVTGMDWFTPERAVFSTAPRNLHPAARSILAVGIAYRGADPGLPDDGQPRGRISRYAWGVDYHKLLKQRMRTLHERIEAHLGRPVEARLLTDTARIVDRAVSARAGLGWYGKHSCLIVPGFGSWVLLGELLLDLELEPDQPLDRDCGSCTICLNQCPTGALVAPYTVDAPRCLSFQTIEQRGAIPHEIRPRLGAWVFGCDVCQEVCPYTGAARKPADPAFTPARIEQAYPPLRWLLTMTEDEFREVYRGTPVLRAKRRGLARNAAVALGNVGGEADIPWLIAALDGHDELLPRGHAAWALGRFGGAAARAALDRARQRDPDPWVREEATLALETFS